MANTVSGSKSLQQEAVISEAEKYHMKLRLTITELKFNLDNAIAGDAFGPDDPHLKLFSQEIKRIEDIADETQSSKEQTTEESLWLTFKRLTGFIGSPSTPALEQLKDNLGVAQDLCIFLIRTTSSSPSYSEICAILPSDGSTLSMLEDGSTMKFLSDSIDLIHSTKHKPVFLHSQISRSKGLLHEDTVRDAFNALHHEVDFILKVPSVKANPLIHGIVECTFWIARVFVIMLNRFYQKKADDAYANFASDRFKTVYQLLESISCLIQDLEAFKELDGLSKTSSQPHSSPLSEILHPHDSAEGKQSPELVQPCSPTGPGIYRQMYQDRIAFFREMQGKSPVLSSCRSFDHLLRSCVAFVVGTEELLKKARTAPKALDKHKSQSQGRMKYKIGTNEAFWQSYTNQYATGVFRNRKDPVARVVAEHKISSAPLAEELTLEVVIDNLKELKLFQLSSSSANQEIIGSGSHGVVYRMPYRDSNLLVAVKRFDIKGSSAKNGAYKRLLREATATAGIEHPNILSVYGFLNSEETHATTGISLVLPFHLHGSLDAYLVEHQPVPELVKTKLLRDVAAALEFLHDTKIQKGGIIIHGDLRAANILVRTDQSALLADFGLAWKEDMDKSLQTENYKTNDAWLPIEFFDINNEKPSLSIYSDIYAFGCVYYEAIHEKVPYHDLRPMGDLWRHKAKGKTPTVNIPENYRLQAGHKAMMARCWIATPEYRASASQMVKSIKLIIECLSESSSAS